MSTSSLVAELIRWATLQRFTKSSDGCQHLLEQGKGSGIEGNPDSIKPFFNVSNCVFSSLFHLLEVHGSLLSFRLLVNTAVNSFGFRLVNLSVGPFVLRETDSNLVL